MIVESTKHGARFLFNKEWIDAFMAMPYNEQRRDYFQRLRRNNVTEVELEFRDTTNFIVFKKTYIDIAFSGKNFFRKKTFGGKFIYNKNSKRIISTYNREDLLKDLCVLPNLKWLEDCADSFPLLYKVLSNTIARDILLGKLTNIEGVIKAYLKSLKAKGVDWEVYLEYLNHPSLSMPIHWLELATTDVNAYLRVLLSKDDKKVGLFKDMIREALALHRKINPEWPFGRMLKEHFDMISALNMEQYEKLDSTPFYPNMPVFDYPCTLLNTERDLLINVLGMGYYFSRIKMEHIKSHRYLYLFFPGTNCFTLGLKLTTKGFVIDDIMQLNSFSDSKEVIAVAKAFLEDKKVTDTLNSLHGLLDFSECEEFHGNMYYQEEYPIEKSYDLPF